MMSFVKTLNSLALMTSSSLPLLFPEWPAPNNVLAFSTYRHGGVSQGDYAGLNLGLHVGDSENCVLNNRRILPYFERIVWLNQVHGNRCVQLGTKKSGSTPEADASISRDPRFFCAVMTADCVPILVCNKKGTEVAAIHAGWQGLVKGVIASTIGQMRSTSDQLMAWIGPSISGSCYEVDKHVLQHFLAHPNAITPSDEKNKGFLDLPLIAKHQLQNLGLTQVIASGRCTYSEEENFFSHRRAYHQGKKFTGRMVSVIGLDTSSLVNAEN